MLHQSCCIFLAFFSFTVLYSILAIFSDNLKLILAPGVRDHVDLFMSSSVEIYKSSDLPLLGHSTLIVRHNIKLELRGVYDPFKSL